MNKAQTRCNYPPNPKLVKERLFYKIVHDVRLASETGVECFYAQFGSENSWFRILYNEQLNYVYKIYTFQFDKTSILSLTEINSVWRY